MAAGGPLSDALRGQITAAVERRDGFATNLVASGRATADDVDRQIYRGKLLWDVTDGIDAKLTVSGWNYTDWTGRDLVAAGVPEANGGVALYGGVTSRDQDEFATTIAGDDDLNETAADLRFDVSLGDLSFVSVTTYTETDFDYTFDVDASSINLLDLDAVELSETWSQEFQLLSREGASLEWIAGGYFYSQQASNLFVFEDPVSAQPAFAVGTDISNGLQGVSTDSFAVFAQGSYAFRERWTATLGGRWTRESKARDGRRSARRRDDPPDAVCGRTKLGGLHAACGARAPPRLWARVPELFARLQGRRIQLSCATESGAKPGNHGQLRNRRQI